MDEQRRFWITYPDEIDEDVCDIREDLGQVRTEVKIAFPMSHNVLTSRRGVCKMKGMHFKSEIAQRELSDLQRIPSAL